MAFTQLIEKQYLPIEEGKNYNFNDLFILNGGNRIFLKNLTISFGATKSSKLKSLKEFNNLKTKTGAASDGNPRLATSSGVVLSTINGPFTKVLDIPKYYESTSILSTEQSPVGYKKYLEVAQTSSLNKNAYFMIYVKNAKEPKFVKLNELFYYEGARKKSVQIPAGATLKEVVDGKDLFTAKGDAVTSVYIEQSYNFKQCEYTKTIDGKVQTFQAAETFDANNLEKHSYTVIIKEDGTPVFKENVIKLNNQIITHENSTMMEDAGKNNGEIVEVNTIAIKEFNVSHNDDANFVGVVLENQNLIKLVSVEGIYLEDKSTKANPLTDYVGKSVYVKIDDAFYKTNPLTLDQVSVKYEEKEFYQRSIDANDALADNSYLLTKDGTYQKETEVAHPIYYTFVADNETNFDAYIATIVDADGSEKQIVIDKQAYEEAYKKNLSSSFTIDGYKIDIAKVHKAKQTHNFSLCDAVQTTSKGNNIEFCKIYAAEEKTEEEQSIQQEAFEQSYKQGEYKLNKVFVNSNGTQKLVELDERYERFTLSDSYKVKNLADYKIEYQALNEKPFKYTSKDGELGKITGGPSYDIGKAISKSFKTYGSYLANGLAFLYNPAGILFTFACAPVVALGIVSAVVAPIAIPIYQGIYGAWKNSFGKFKRTNQSKFNEKVWQKDLIKNLEHIYTETKTNENRTETKFVNACHKIDAMVNTLKQANMYSDFKMVDGEVEINSHNCASVCEFMKQAKAENNLLKTGKLADKRKLEKTLAKLLKKENLTAEEELELNRTKELLKKQSVCKRYLDLKDKKKLTEDEKSELVNLELEYNNYKDEFKNKMTNYTHAGYTTKPTKKSKQLVENAEVVKSFLYVKHIVKDEDLLSLIETELGLSNEDEKTAKITEIKEMLNGLDYDFENNLFKHGNDRYSYKTCAENDAHMYGMGPSQQQIQTSKTLKLIKKLMESKTVKEKVGNLQSTNVEETPILEEEPIVEEEISLTPPAEAVVEDEIEKANKPKTKRLNKVVITSENSVAQQLEDQNSIYYKNAIKNLTRKNGKYKMSEEEAVSTIFDFVDKINQAHAEKKHAKDVFEKGSLEAYILSNITKSMAKAATLEYLPKEKKNLSV